MAVKEVCTVNDPSSAICSNCNRRHEFMVEDIENVNAVIRQAILNLWSILGLHREAFRAIMNQQGLRPQFEQLELEEKI